MEHFVKKIVEEMVRLIKMAEKKTECLYYGFG